MEKDLPYQAANNFMRHNPYSLPSLESSGRLYDYSRLDAAWDALIEVGIDPEQNRETLLELAETIDSTIPKAAAIETARIQLVRQLNQSI